MSNLIVETTIIVSLEHLKRHLDILNLVNCGKKMIDKIDLNLFKRIIHEGRHNTVYDDSYSINQFRAKERLINHVEFLGIERK